MATIGLSKPYYAIYNNVGTTVTYSDGAVIGKAVELSMEIEGGDPNVLYADNGPAESANTFAGGTLTLTTDDLLPAPMMGILGIKEEAITDEAVKTAGAAWLVFDDDQNTPYVGFGGIIKKQQSGATKWVAVVYPKIQFQNTGDAATTQGETIEWQTPELTATLMRDDTEKHVWRYLSTPLDTEAEAEAAVKKILNITEPTLGNLTVNSAAGTDAGETKITVTPTITPGNSYTYKTGATVELPEYEEVCDSGYTPWNGTDEITATNGQEILVVEVNTPKQAQKAGKTTITTNQGV